MQKLNEFTGLRNLFTISAVRSQPLKYGPSHTRLSEENVDILLAIIFKSSSFLTVNIGKAGSKLWWLLFIYIFIFV